MRTPIYNHYMHYTQANTRIAVRAPLDNLWRLRLTRASYDFLMRSNSSVSL